jgi:hypothetical protein
MTEHFTFGDIIRGNSRGRNKAYHPIIYLGEVNEEFFQGGMLTHSKGFGNIRLLYIHFNGSIANDDHPTYFVRNALLKKHEWGPFNKFGELSELGIEIIQNQLNSTTPQIWEDYIKKE